LASLDILKNLNFNLGVSSPARKSFNITPADGVDLPTITRAIYVGLLGDIVVMLADDTGTVTLKSVPGGSLLPLQIRRVQATGTTAGFLVGLI
jgi:hypothetical protein